MSDQSGVADFRAMISELDSDLHYLQQEKFIQYSKMQGAISLMKTLNLETSGLRTEKDKKIKMLKEKAE